MLTWDMIRVDSLSIYLRGSIKAINFTEHEWTNLIGPNHGRSSQQLMPVITIWSSLKPCSEHCEPYATKNSRYQSSDRLTAIRFRNRGTLATRDTNHPDRSGAWANPSPITLNLAQVGLTTIHVVWK